MYDISIYNLNAGGFILNFFLVCLVSGKAFKSLIVEEVESLSREPKNGLFPAGFDEKVWFNN